MKRFQAVPEMLVLPNKTDDYWWKVWDWSTKRTTVHSYMTRGKAKRLARKLNKHSWLIDRDWNRATSDIYGNTRP